MTEQPIDFRETYTPLSAEDMKQLNPIILLTLGVIGGLVIGFLLFGAEAPIVNANAHGYLTNAFTEGISIIITVVLVAAWQERQRIQREKKRLVHEAGSRSNERAKAAIDDLRDLGWIEGENGLLKGMSAYKPNLADVDFLSANLEGAALPGANLSNATCEDVNLSNVDLFEANLEGANLSNANLEKAILRYANLEGTNLMSASLRGANLSAATLNRETILPDGTRYQPELGMEQLERFGAIVTKPDED